MNASPQVMVEYANVDTPEGELWIEIRKDRKPYQWIGPFVSSAERENCLADLLQMIRSLGGKDMGSA